MKVKAKYHRDNAQNEWIVRLHTEDGSFCSLCACEDEQQAYAICGLFDAAQDWMHAYDGSQIIRFRELEYSVHQVAKLAPLPAEAIDLKAPSEGCGA